MHLKVESLQHGSTGGISDLMNDYTYVTIQQREITLSLKGFEHR